LHLAQVLGVLLSHAALLQNAGHLQCIQNPSAHVN